MGINQKLLTIVVLGIILRLIFIGGVGGNPDMYTTPDSPAYLNLAKNLLSHASFSADATAPFKPDTVRTPGYPLFLALFHQHEKHPILPIVIFQMLLNGFTCGLFFYLSLILWSNNKAAFISGILAAIDFVVILYSSFIMTESLFLFLYTLSLLFLALHLKPEKKGLLPLAISGLVLGLATWVRPVSLYYFLIPIPIIYFIKQNSKTIGRSLLIWLSCSLLLPTAWVVRNKLATGTWTYTTIQGLTRAAILEERLSHLSYDEAIEKLEKKFSDEHPRGFSSSIEKAKAESFWATKYILQYPLEYSQVLIKESIRLLAGNGMKATAWMLFKDHEYNPYTIVVHPKESNSEQTQMLLHRHPTLVVAMVIYLTFLSCIYFYSLRGLWWNWKHDRPLAVWLGLSVFYFFLVSIGFGTGARYRIPLMPPLYLLAGIGFYPNKKTL